MEGSIADSTVHRMRTQLQRMHHSAPASQADGFLEELFKLPAATPAAERESTDETEAADASSSLPTTAATQPSKETDDGNDEASDKEASQSDTPVPIAPLCYAPSCMPEPQRIEPVASTQATEDAGQVASAAVPSAATVADVEAQVASNVPVDDAAGLTVSVEQAESDSAPLTNELVQPVQSKVDVPVQDSRLKLRETRRSGDARDRAGSKVDQPQTSEKAVTDRPAQTTTGRSEPTAIKPLEQPSHVQPVAVDVQSKTSREPDDRTNRVDESRQRGKWYEGDAQGNSEEQTTLVERMQASASETDEKHSQLSADALNGAVNNVHTSDASETPLDSAAAMLNSSVQSRVDNASVASDAAAAAQANLTQSQNSQRVTGASETANVDSAGRGNQAAPGVASALGSTIGRGGVAASISTQSTAKRSSSTAEADQPREISQQERVRLVQRVARSFSRLGPEGGQVTLKLHPPQLGVLNVSIKIEGHSMTARLQTETSSARDAIVESLPVLRERLSEQGIEIEKFQVDVGQQDSQSSSGQMNNFAGNSGNSQQNESASPSDFDYRRYARANAARQIASTAPNLEPKLQNWNTADRSLDVRA